MNKKRILVNGSFSSHHFAFRNVILNISRQLSMCDEYETYILLRKDADVKDFKTLNVNIIYTSVKSDSAFQNKLYTMFVMPFLLLKHKIDLVIYQQGDIYIANPRAKVLLYMHDLIEYNINSHTKKQMIVRKLTYPFVCKHADKIITVSNCSKKDLVGILGIASDKIEVALNGKDEALIPVEKTEARAYIKKKYGIENFVFYIGYLTHPQKNLIYLIDEFSAFKKNYSDAILVFAGAKGKDADIILKHAVTTLNTDFKYLGKVPYDDLKYLYSAAKIFCFPSLYEGFGMPVLEAMSCGAVVLTSNRSSIPEIQTDTRYQFNPEAQGDLSELLHRYYRNNNDEIINKNITASQKFTWDEHGKVLRQTVSSLL